MKYTTTQVKGLMVLLCAILFSANSFGQLRISQVYGAGGNGGATYNRDFVELFNAGSSSITVTNYALQYASATGSGWNVGTFSGTIPAGGYFLIATGTVGGSGIAIPTADATISTIAMAAAAGKIVLTSSNTILVGTCPTGGNIVDFVGFGTTASCFEGAGPTPAPSTTTSVSRGSGGCTDANSNNTDFTAGTINPRNSASPINSCSLPPTVTTDPATVTASTDATLNGTVNANGGSSVVTFQYGTTISYGSTVTATPSPVTGVSATSVSAGVTGLSVNTLYNYRVVATAATTVNGSNATFYTFANVPSAPTVVNPTSSTLDVSITGTDGNPSTTEYAIQETGSTNYVQASGALGASAVWQTASAWGTKTVTGLTSSTTYIFQVKARNGALVETAFGLTGSGTTSASGSPTITVTASLTPFSSVAGVASASQNYTVSGSFLTNDIIITPPVDFEISTDNSTWVSNPSTITLTQAGGNVATTTIYVHFNSAVAGTFSGSIDHSTIGGGSQTLAVSGTALALEPLTASAVSFGATGATTMTINFVSGSGASRIVVLKAGSAVGFVPTDGSPVSGVNANFSLASDQGSGDRIVYDGTGNTVNVTGLSSSTTYHVAVYEYNGTLVTSNYLATPGTGLNPTSTLEPTIASTLTFGTITDISMVLNFTGGNGTSRIVVAHENSAVTFGPADLTSYTGINSDFSLAVDQGSGDKIVYDGTGTTVTVTGLTVGNTYFYKVYEYNGSGSLTNYLLTPNGSNSNSTVGPVPYSVTGSTYSQSFNGLPSSGTFVVPSTGFPFYVASSPVSATGIVGWQYGVVSGTPRFGVSDGSGTITAAAFSCGVTSNPERSLGVFASGSNTSNIGLVLSNTTSDILNTVTITFKGEQWRRGTGSANVLTFKYSVGGSNLNTGTFTAEPTLNFTSPVASNPTDVPLDGNIAPNFTNVSATFTLNANWMPGQTLVLRWDDFNDPANDDMISIDDFTFVATGPQTPTTQDNNISFSGTLTNATSVNWINGDGTNRIVVMNTTNSFTNPVDGSSFTANTVYGGGEQVVYNGTGSTVNVTNLSPSTQYFFRVYGYNGTGLASKFNTTTATLNPNDVTTADPSFPTQLVVLNVNNGTDVIVNQPFTITIQAQDNFGSPQNVTQNTTIDLSVFVGFGGLFSGTTSGIMTAGTNQITITGVVYDLADFGVVLNAATSAGDILFDGQTPSFDVFDIATQVAFVSTPTNGVVNSIVNTFYVHALRPDFSVDQYYVGSATIAYSSGPGTVTGTLTAPFVNGIATFSDIVFSQVGTYVLEATSGSLLSAFSPSILINPPVSFTELVVPKYMGSKTTGATNTDRTPIAVCVQIDYLAPNTLYNLAAGMGLTSEANTALGAGTIWNGTAFASQIRNGAFTTDANGSSGPLWIYFQPSGNASRFSAGEVHNIRIAYSAGTFGTIVPNFVTTKTITSLDIAGTGPLTTTTLDDGAFLTGALSACIGGKHILIYDNIAGTGDPLYSYVANPGPTQPTQTTLPVSVDQIFMGTAAAGTFAAVYPIGANGPNGVRRVEARNEDNSISAFETSATGIWAAGTNTTNATRREVKALTNVDVNLSSITVSTSSTNLTCFGVATGTATATASSLNTPITYSWSPGAETTSSISSLAAGTYVVTATDGIGCTASSTVIVTEPADIFIVGQVTNTGCVGGDIGAVDITVGGGTAPFTYSWSNGPTTEDISGLAAGSYTVIVTDANGCSKSETFTVITQNTSPTITVTATPSTICAGQSSILEATGATTYTWSPAGSLSSSTDPIVTATPSTTTTYSVVAVDGFGCQSIGSVTLTVNPLPIVVVTPVTSSICGGSSVSLSATGASTYAWSPTTELSATTGSPVIATPSASTVYTVVGTSVDNCTASATASITVTSVDAPTATSPITYCQNVTASALTATALPGNDLWWYTTPTGGNGASVAPVPSTATAGSTTYYVSQQLSNPLSIAINGYLDNGAPDEYTFVALSKIPAGTVIYFTDNGWTGTGFRGATALDANGSEGFVRWTAINTVAAGTVIRSAVSTADYAWTTSGPITCSTCTGTNNYTPLDFAGAGDQICAFTSTTTDNPLFNTAQQIHLYVFDDTNAFENATSTATGSVPPGLTAGITANTFAFGSSNYVNMINDAQTRTPSAWRAYMAISTNYTTGIGVNPGLPSTNLNVDLGCESPRTPITVIVNPAPVVDAVALTPILCNGGTSTVMVTASGATVPYTGEGTFTVVAGTYNYTVSDANGCSGSASITVTEPTLLTATSVETVAILCNGGLASVTVSGSGGTAPYTGEGVFNVLAGTHNFTVTDVNGCTAVTTITISEPTAIVVTATVTSPIVCPGGTATITVTATGGTGAYTGEGTFTVLAGTYNYTVTDINGCSGITSITVSDPAAVGVTNFTPSTGCVGSTVSIFGSNLNLVTAIDLNGISAIFVLVNPGEITVTVPPTATSGVFNLYTAANCTTSTTSSFIVTNCSTGITVNINAFIYGYYVGGQTMTPTIMNELVANATGAETDTITVLLYTWDGDGGTIPVLASDSAKGILMTDGSCTVVANAPDGSYYIALRHRNSLLTFSSVALACSSATPVSYNFTTAISQAAFDNQIDLGDGFFAMYNGDFNQDQFIDGNDFTVFDLQSTLGDPEDYWTNDMNGDGFVDGNDFTPFDGISVLGLESIVHP